jgi:hypothetical protein
VKNASAVALLILIIPIVAHGQAVPVQLTNTLITQYRTDNQNLDDTDDDYAAVINRLNLNANSGSLSTSARIDSMGFLDTHQPWHHNDARLERIKVQYKLGDWTLKVGDMYRQLGRGLLLNLRKVDEAGLDIILRGGEAAYASSKQYAGIFAGRTNIVNIDVLKQRFVDDPNDILAGGWYALRRIPVGAIKMEVGLHYLFRQNAITEANAESKNASNNIGGKIEFPELGEYGSLYLETDIQQARNADTLSEGRAAYGAMDIFLGDTSLLFEGIYLDNFKQYGRNNRYGEPLRYNQAPTLDRIDQETSLGQNEWGGRARIEHAFADGDFVLYANGMYKKLDPDELSEVIQIHGYGGFKGEFDGGRSRYTASGGYRDENASGGTTTRDIKHMTHAEFDYVHYITSGYSLQLAGNYEFRTLEDNSYNRGSSFVGIQKAGVGSVTIEHGQDTSDERTGVRQQFLAGILSFDASKNLKVRSTIGSQRGGLKCVGGVCRIYPSFSGYQLSLLSNHDLGG